MFLERNEELKHLIELYQETSTTNTSNQSKQNEHLKILRTKIESFSKILINYMIEDKDLDVEFANTVYLFDSKLFLTIFKEAISEFYLQIGFNECLRIVGELKYFSQAIEGYKTIYAQIKLNLSNFHENAYKLREKLQKTVSMKDFSKLSVREKSEINEMIAELEPYAILPKPVKSKRIANWAEHYYHQGLIETKFNEEKESFYSLFRTET